MKQFWINYYPASSFFGTGHVDISIHDTETNSTSTYGVNNINVTGYANGDSSGNVYLEAQVANEDAKSNIAYINGFVISSSVQNLSSEQASLLQERISNLLGTWNPYSFSPLVAASTAASTAQAQALAASAS